MLQLLNEAGSKLAQYTDNPGGWGGLISQRRGITTSFYVFDPESNARHLLDSTGAVAASYNYLAFGDELTNSGTINNPYRFGGEVGYYRDRSTQLYVRARHLNVPQARWLQRDPIGFDSGDWNLYRYVGNNPLSIVDPSGMFVVIEGETICNELTGERVIRIYDKSCTKDCTKAHEQVHYDDIATCCRRYSACVQRALRAGLKADWQACTAAWNRWIVDSSPFGKWSECRAYYAGLRCRLAMNQPMNCDCAFMNLPIVGNIYRENCSQCCREVCDSIANDVAQIKRYCGGASPSVNPPANAGCPFSWNGRII